MKKKDALILEYNANKQEINSLMSRIDQLLVTEYTISLSFLAIGYELRSSLFMIITIIFIISLQELINTRRRHMIRAAIYIEKFIEKNIKGLKWETLVGKVDGEYRKKYMQKNFFMSIYYFILNNTALVIALISSILYFILIYEEYGCITYRNILIMAILFLILVIQCISYTNFRKMGNRYYEIFKKMYNKKTKE